VGTPREDLAAKLREARIEAGYGSQGALAKRLNVSRPVISKAESATHALPSIDVINAWAGATGAPVDELLELVGRARSGTPEWFMPYQLAEARANLLRYWSPMVVPGLLQTASYMRALFEDEVNLMDRIDGLVSARMERQLVIGRVHVTAMISQQVLQRLVGSASVMAEQCAHLVNLAEHSGVALHVVPEGTNMGLWGAFDIAARDSVVTVCLETVEDVTSTAPHLVGKVTEAYERLLGAALPRAESLKLIRTAEEQWKTQI
jgi:transcriptional regulator with XRE-family HTH domain